MGKLFEKIKKGVSYLIDGLYTIGEGMSSISLYPDTTSTENILIPKRKASVKKDYFNFGYQELNRALRSDREVVGKDLEKAINDFEKNNISKK